MARQLKNQAGGWLPCAWEEYVGQDSSHGASFSSGWDDGSQATFQIFVPWQNGLDAELALLGSANFNGTSLTRTLPAQHPYKSSYRAERILSAQPVHWDHKSAGFQAGFQGGTPISEYSYWLLSIGFAQPKYKVLSDAQLLNKYGAMQEWQRFVEVQPRYSTTMLSREGQLWNWADSGGGNDGPGPTPNGPQIGGQLTAPIGVPINGIDLVTIWKRIPRRGLYGSKGESDLFNGNILNNLNKLHNAATNLWNQRGNAASSGTLRFVGVEADVIPSPFGPAAQGLGATDYNTYHNVSLHWHVWNPPPGNPGNASLTSGYYGHNLAPNPADNLWYLITTMKGHATIFQMADLTQVFQLSDT